MKIAIVGEGQTEFYCVPTIVGRLGHQVVGVMHIRGGCDLGYDWPRFVGERIAPAVEIMAYRKPEKIVVVLDREDRDACSPELARTGLTIVQEKCGRFLGNCEVGIVVSNRRFECLLFADYQGVDRLPILRMPVSGSFPPTTEGENVIRWIHGALRRGFAYDKIRDGKFLAQRIALRDPVVLGRSRSLSKLVSDL